MLSINDLNGRESSSIYKMHRASWRREVCISKLPPIIATSRTSMTCSSSLKFQRWGGNMPSHREVMWKTNFPSMHQGHPHVHGTLGSRHRITKAMPTSILASKDLDHLILAIIQWTRQNDFGRAPGQRSILFHSSLGFILATKHRIVGFWGFDLLTEDPDSLHVFTRTSSPWREKMFWQDARLSHSMGMWLKAQKRTLPSKH